MKTPCVKNEIAFFEKVFLKPVRPNAPLRGVELFNLNLVRDLTDAGHDIFLPLHKSWEPAVRKFAGKNLRTCPIPALIHPALTCLAAAFAIVAETFKANRFPVLFVANDVNGAIPALRVMKRLGAFDKAVVFAHKMPSRRFATAVSDLPGSIVCVCGQIASEFRKYKTLASVSADYGIANAGDFHPAEQSRPNDGIVNFCLLGDMESDWKGADTALAAFALLPPEIRRQARLHVKAFRTPRELPADSGVIQHPWTNADNVPDFLRGMDALIVPSRNRSSDGRLMETFSQTTVQGMLTALPVIHTTISSLAEKFDQGGGIAADTPEEFAAAIEKLVENPQLRIRLGHEARQTALDRYTWDSTRFFNTYMKP